jgi:hypothetical protein
VIAALKSCLEAFLALGIALRPVPNRRILSVFLITMLEAILRAVAAIALAGPNFAFIRRSKTPKGLHSDEEN